jgi:hypothetical protein
MKRLAFLLLLAATAAGAQTSNFGGCNAARVTAGDCSDATHVFFLFSGPSAAMLDFRDTLSASGNWQATIPCEPVRRVSEGVLQAAGVAEDGCVLESSVANPQSENQAAMNHLAFNLRRWQQRATTVPEQVPAETQIGKTSIP